MMESQRYPDDFDGIVAAAPAYDWTGITAGFVQNQQAIYPDGNLDAPVLTPSTLEAARLEHPRRVRCGRRWSRTGCSTIRGAAASRRTTCRAARATARPATASRRRNSPRSRPSMPARPRNGESIYHGFNYGGEHDRGGWDSWVVSAAQRRSAGVPNAQYGFGTELYKYFVFRRSDWDYKQYDLFDLEGRRRGDRGHPQRDRHRPERLPGPRREDHSTGPAGPTWRSPRSARSSTTSSSKRGDPAASDYARLYMLPGVLHCAGGPRPRPRRLGGGDPRLGRRGQCARAPAGVEARPGRPRDDDAAAVVPYPQVAAYDGDGGIRTTRRAFACALP